MRTGTETGGLLMRRPAPRAVAALALLALAACTGTGAGTNGPGGAAEDGKPGSSVRADAFETVWSRSVRGESGVPAVTDDVVLVPHGHLIDVRDPRTGKSRRTVRADPADRIASVGLSGDVIVARAERYASVALQGFDLRTGRKLWAKWYGTGAIVRPGDGPELPVQGPVVVTGRGIAIHAHDGRITGLNPRTGEPAWQKQAGCDSEDHVADYTVAATARYSVMLCSKGTRHELTALDPRDGHRVWQADITDRGGRGTFSTHEDVVGVRSADAHSHKAAFTLFDESGDRLATGTVKDPVGDIRTVGRVGDTVYFHDGRQLHAFRTDGSQLWRQAAPEDLVATARVIVSDGETLGPDTVMRTGVSVVIGLSGKERAILPWPLRGELVGASGERFIVRGREEDGARYTALRLTRRGLEEPALGGVAPADWPDACSLLSDEQLEGLGGDHVRLPIGGSRTVFGVKLPHATRCRFVPASGSDKDIFVFTLRWVSADADTARELSTSDLPWDTGVRRLGTGGHLVADPRVIGLALGWPAVVASGRNVIEIDAAKNDRLVRRIASLLSG
ncbi:PQQ-binding-like beta-propeller repeat protein [Streptomyces sp. NPDC059517]|uniref:outer membrane protein assembly factor BamB family protein n=1 Tax=Streptomyces sp. NPDC059517 TaxID=3346855 RepID=UPI00367364DF